MTVYLYGNPIRSPLTSPARKFPVLDRFEFFESPEITLAAAWSPSRAKRRRSASFLDSMDAL
jgi:hypothetical protein